MENPETGIAILGINGAGYGNNEAICEGRDIPWLQDTQDDDWWGGWDITFRDVVILNRDGNEEAVFNLTEYNLGNPDEYAALKVLLLDIAGQEPITTTTTTLGCTSDVYCDDGLFCNGVEICDPGAGCRPGSNPCSSGTICVEQLDFCEEQHTTTIPTTTTTITCACPIVYLYGNYAKNTEILRALRDNFLAQTPEGRELIKLYYQWSPVIITAMEHDEDFKEEVEDAVEEVLEMME